MPDCVRGGGYPRATSERNCSTVFQRRKLILGGVALNVGVLLFVTFVVLVNQPSYEYASPTEHEDESSTQHEQFCISGECNKTAQSFLMSMDMGANPCEDFHRFACGNWSSVLSTMFNSTQLDVPRNDAVEYADALRAQDRDQILRMIDEIQPSDIEALQQLKLFFNSCTDDGPNTPVDKEWIGELLNRLFLPEDSIGRTLARIKRELGLNFLFTVSAGVNKDKNLEKELIIGESPLATEDLLMGMFSRSGEMKLNKILKMFDREVNAITRKLGIIGDSKSTKKIVELDEDLFRVMVGSKMHDRPARLQPGNFKHFNLRDLNDLFPNWDFFAQVISEREHSRLQHMDFEEYMKTLFEGVPDVNISKLFTVGVKNVYHVKKVGHILGTIPISQIRMYLIAHVLVKLGTDFTDGAVLEMNVRQKACVMVMEKAMPFATAHKLVMAPAREGKAKQVQEIFDYVSVAFNSTISSLEWMDPTTKSHAMRKVNNIKAHIGYPHWLLNSSNVNEYYEGLNFTKNGKMASFAQNGVTFRTWRTEKILKEFHLPVSSDYIWDVIGNSSATVNLFYLGERNAIGRIYPRSYLRFPYFGTGISAIDYGALGSSLGHGIANGFDSDWRERDESGKLSSCRNITSDEGFKKQTLCFINQYERYWTSELGYTGPSEAGQWLNTQGNRTLDEDISDNWGLRAAFQAHQLYKNSSGGQEQTLPGLEEYSSRQLFFLSFAHSHCAYNEQSGQRSWERGTHSPNWMRVIGPLSNYEDFSRAWECRIGSGMNPEKKCDLWV